MTKTGPIRLRVSLRWWFKPYLWGLATVAYLTGRTPDPSKVERMVRRAVVVRLEPVVFGIEA
jgi:hypothetical protein